MTLVFIGKGLVLEGWPLKTEIIWVLGIYWGFINGDQIRFHTKQKLQNPQKWLFDLPFLSFSQPTQVFQRACSWHSLTPRCLVLKAHWPIVGLHVVLSSSSSFGTTSDSSAAWLPGHCAVWPFSWIQTPIHKTQYTPFWRNLPLRFHTIPSMYGIFTYIWLIFIVNVAKYTVYRIPYMAPMGSDVFLPHSAVFFPTSPRVLPPPKPSSAPGCPSAPPHRDPKNRPTYPCPYWWGYALPGADDYGRSTGPPPNGFFRPALIRGLWKPSAWKT